MAGTAEEPSLSEVLQALAEAESIDSAASRVGLTQERLRGYLRETAQSLAWTKHRPSVKAPESKPAEPKKSEPKKVETPAAPAPVSAATHHVVQIFSDGAARGNPGPAGAGAVVRTTDGKVIARLGKFLGVQTNNVAEYEGLIIGLQKALEMGAREVHVFADSLLVISQLRGEWKIKHPGLRPLYDKARVLITRFDRATLRHVPREQNKEADEMSNRAIDERMA